MPTATAPARATTAGVVFIERDQAMIARSTDTDPIVITVAHKGEGREAFLGRVAREVEDCERVMIMGLGPERLAFEREYVSLYKRPDRLVHEELVVRTTGQGLLYRLARLER
jgi:hypothetical protein